MATTTAPNQTLPLSPSRPTAPDRAEPRQVRPIVAWASIGALFWVFQAWVLLRWFTGPYFTPVKIGPDDPPTRMKITITAYLVLQGILFVGLFYRLVVRPWIRDRRLGFDGILLIAFWAFYWFWDPLANAFGLFFTYNSWAPNMGSWVNSIPGVLTAGSPGHQTVEPFLFGVYGAVYVPLIIAGCWLMRKIQQKWQLGLFATTATVFAIFFILEIPLELAWMQVGLYTYAGSIKALTLFPGHWYAYPLYESLWAIPVTALTYLRYTRDDQGRSLAERGLDRVAARGAKDAMRLLAISGFFLVSALLYFIPIAYLSANSEHWPRDVTTRSYLTDYLCGPGTTRACPDSNVPLFKPHSVTITPNGKLYVPKGVKPIRQPTSFKNSTGT
jgi:Spirocyclase AveC-like